MEEMGKSFPVEKTMSLPGEKTLITKMLNMFSTNSSPPVENELKSMQKKNVIHKGDEYFPNPDQFYSARVECQKGKKGILKNGVQVKIGKYLSFIL